MMKMLTKPQFARLAARLTLPVALAEIAERGSVLDESEGLVLQILLADMSPLQALASIACAAGILSSLPGFDKGAGTAIKLQADFVLDDYGPLVLHQELSGEDPVLEEGWVTHIQEDLESFADHLGIAGDLAGPGAVLTRQLCLLLEGRLREQAACLDAIEETAVPAPPPCPIYADNVIPFPGSFFGHA